MLTARFRHPQFDIRNYVLEPRLPAGDTIVAFERVDTAKGLFFTSDEALTPDGRAISFQGWGGIVNFTHTLLHRIETSSGEIRTLMSQFIITAPFGAGCTPEPPPGWPPLPPGVGNVDLDVGVFDQGNNTGQCPTP
jgi:hypothetical protein